VEGKKSMVVQKEICGAKLWDTNWLRRGSP